MQQNTAILISTRVVAGANFAKLDRMAKKHQKTETGTPAAAKGANNNFRFLAQTYRGNLKKARLSYQKLTCNL